MKLTKSVGKFHICLHSSGCQFPAGNSSVIWGAKFAAVDATNYEKWTCKLRMCLLRTTMCIQTFNISEFSTAAAVMTYLIFVGNNVKKRGWEQFDIHLKAWRQQLNHLFCRVNRKHLKLCYQERAYSIFMHKKQHASTLFWMGRKLKNMISVQEDL